MIGSSLSELMNGNLAGVPEQRRGELFFLHERWLVQDRGCAQARRGWLLPCRRQEEGNDQIQGISRYLPLSPHFLCILTGPDFSNAVAPAELEAILMENEEIADVGVIGVPDEYTGDELPRYAFLQLWLVCIPD